MDDQRIVLGIASTIILSLIGALWSMVTQERKSTADALAKTASLDELKEVRDELRRQHEKMATDFNQRLMEQKNTHDKDMDRMRSDLDKIINLVGDVSKKVDSYNVNIMHEMQEIKVSIAAFGVQK